MSVSLTNQDEYRVAVQSIKSAIDSLKRGINKAAQEELGRAPTFSERRNPGGYAEHARSALSELEGTLRGLRLTMSAIDRRSATKGGYDE